MSVAVAVCGKPEKLLLVLLVDGAPVEDAVLEPETEREREEEERLAMVVAVELEA